MPAKAFGNYGLLPPATQNYKPTATVPRCVPPPRALRNPLVPVVSRLHRDDSIAGFVGSVGMFHATLIGEAV